MQVVLTIFLFHISQSKFYDSYKFTLYFLLDSHFNKKYFSFHWVLVALETKTDNILPFPDVTSTM